MFKVIFPSGYIVSNINNDNIDVCVALQNGNVYAATFFTILNIQMLMKSKVYYWAADMVIVKDLRRETIKEAVLKIILDENLDYCFLKIGTIETIYSKKSFDELLAGC